jgi:hypothetical protein
MKLTSMKKHYDRFHTAALYASFRKKLGAQTSEPGSTSVARPATTPAASPATTPAASPTTTPAASPAPATTPAVLPPSPTTTTSQCSKGFTPIFQTKTSKFEERVERYYPLPLTTSKG